MFLVWGCPGRITHLFANYFVRADEAGNPECEQTRHLYCCVNLGIVSFPMFCLGFLSSLGVTVLATDHEHSFQIPADVLMMCRAVIICIKGRNVKGPRDDRCRHSISEKKEKSFSRSHLDRKGVLQPYMISKGIYQSCKVVRDSASTYIY